MDAIKINEAMKKVKPGLEKYLNIMNIVNEVDVSKDENFQKAFNGFYRIRQRSSIFYEKYYSFMESYKSRDISFDKTLLYFYSELGRVEASFSSKLVATINPNLPIWDSVVLKNLNLSQPHYYSKNRIQEIINLYDKINQWYQKFILTDEGKEIISIFDKNYPDTPITEVKKIDFVLWQIRE
ncbi:hypothetical protein [Clostridium intestinale]|uniref:hypothetical protein n=1 Tax=Clostridium intestinale TaxID=36845 RepID=UPI002DD67E82|nr:hypothetical protein [Clostridium intestinale]WRY50596.1 hypothetical protein P8F83_18195 [Clostridium intestinale]